MQTPSQMKELLAGDSQLYASVVSTLGAFEPWLDNSAATFFPEYTGHGPSHTEEVMETAEALITKATWKHLTPADIAVFVLSALTHDIGMYLTEDTFCQITSPEASDALPNTECASWDVLWTNYLREAKRWDEATLRDVTGDAEVISDPGKDSQAWTNKHRKLIGEFIRRYHTQLADSIAQHGVPGPERAQIAFVSIPCDMAAIVGIVARSHGLPLRNALPRLQREYSGLIEYRGIHAVYLMVLLRVADAIQLHAERAPSQLKLVRRLRSPLSAREHAAHQAIRDIRQDREDDPECLFIHAEPDDAVTYERLQQWFRGVQTELDASWAVLGEVYGRFPGLRRLGLTLRRVRTNLDGGTVGTDKFPFYPQRVTFTVADNRLLPLLVQPLYGSRPEVGVRELVQNAVDATRELVARSGSRRRGEPMPQVLAVLDGSGGEAWFSVIDSGIGMTPDTVRDYFLRVGASFRTSPEWQAAYESDPLASLGDKPRSLVQRSGRFGIGVLAAFLLGDEISVTTRHVDARSDRGLEFTIRASSELVEMRYCTRPVGTTIRVRLRDGAFKRLASHTTKWDWYCLADNMVVREMRAAGKTLRQRYSMPTADVITDGRWHRISVPGYSGVDWSYAAAAPLLACNGLVVIDRARRPYPEGVIHAADSGPAFRWPSISVHDPDGRLPLNLERSRIIGPLPFKEQVTEAVLDDYARHCVANAPRSPAVTSKACVEYVSRRHGGQVSLGPCAPSSWMSLPEGICLAEPEFLDVLRPPVVVMVPVHGQRARQLREFIIPGQSYAILPVQVAEGGSAVARWLTFCYGLSGLSRGAFRVQGMRVPMRAGRRRRRKLVTFGAKHWGPAGRYVACGPDDWGVMGWGRTGTPLVDYAGMMSVPEPEPVAEITNCVVEVYVEYCSSRAARISGLAGQRWLVHSGQRTILPWRDD